MGAPRSDGLSHATICNPLAVTRVDGASGGDGSAARTEYSTIYASYGHHKIHQCHYITEHSTVVVIKHITVAIIEI